MTKASVPPGSEAKPGSAATGEPFCRCEATISSAVLDGYACGNPACWRTPIVRASFDAFVADLIRARGASVPPCGETVEGNAITGH